MKKASYILLIVGVVLFSISSLFFSSTIPLSIFPESIRGAITVPFFIGTYIGYLLIAVGVLGILAYYIGRLFKRP